MLNGCTEACSLLKKIYDHQIPKSLYHKTFKIMKLYFKKLIGRYLNIVNFE